MSPKPRPEAGRRAFLQQGAALAAMTSLGPGTTRLATGRELEDEGAFPLRLDPVSLLGGLERLGQPGPEPMAGGSWFRAKAAGDGLEYRFPKGALAQASHLTADLLLDGIHLGVFHLSLQEGEEGPVFHLSFGALNQCSSRMRMPLEAVSQKRWRYEREGAWLKPMCWGERVDLRNVDRMRIVVRRKTAPPLRFCLTPVTATAVAPPRLDRPLLPKGPLLDELGQSRLHDWPGKSRSPDEVSARLTAQLEAAPGHSWPKGFGPWGGWKARRFEASRFFRTEHDGRRSWLVDPDGQAFWSAGLDCVRVDTTAAYRGLESALTWRPAQDGPYAAVYGGPPERPTINYLTANFIRAFGPETWHRHWATVALAELRRLGFNTVANWSEWRIAREARFPYVRPLSDRFERRAPMVFRDFPDVFHDDFAADTRTFAEQLAETRDDPALIGYFLMNEPTWGFADETPAAGMLHATPHCATRQALAGFLRQRYADDTALSQAWGATTTLDAVADGEWRVPLGPKATADLADFSEIMVERLFKGLSDACRAVDPNHLNLGIRYQGVPPPWAVAGMRSFDVFSMNAYEERLPAEQMTEIFELLGLPIMIGEWHFGALDVGLPASGLGHVRTQADRGKAFRVYTEDAAAKPWCVGVHYFTLYDQSALGRFDGENYNIGLLDVCNRPHAPMCDAARESHERVYPIALGEVEPYDDPPEYLPRVFL